MVVCVVTRTLWAVFCRASQLVTKGRLTATSSPTPQLPLTSPTTVTAVGPLRRRSSPGRNWCAFSCQSSKASNMLQYCRASFTPHSLTANLSLIIGSWHLWRGGEIDRVGAGLLIEPVYNDSQQGGSLLAFIYKAWSERGGGSSHHLPEVLYVGLANPISPHGSWKTALSSFSASLRVRLHMFLDSSMIISLYLCGLLFPPGPLNRNKLIPLWGLSPGPRNFKGDELPALDSGARRLPPFCYWALNRISYLLQ